MRSFTFISLLLLLNIQLWAQAPGCPNIVIGSGLDIDIGPILDLECNGQCVTLDATYLETGVTDQYEVSSIPYDPPFPFNSGTPISVNTDDVWSSIINLPFDFCFYNNTYTSVIAGSNGAISFDVGDAGGYCGWSFTASLPSNQLFTNAIFGIYHDIDPSVCGQVYQGVLGEAPCRTFVFNFNDVCHYSCTSIKSTSQVVLYETTNAIEVYIESKPTCSNWNSGNALVGIQNGAGNQSVTPPGRNTGPWTVTTPEAWRFTPSGDSNTEVVWFSDGNQIGTGPSVEVCPASTIDYVAEVTYTSCSTGNEVVERDTVRVNITPPGVYSYANVTITECGNSYTLPSGQAAPQSGIYVDTVVCDSIVIFDLTLFPPSTSSIEVSGCYAVFYNGVEYNSSTALIDTVPNASLNGCDSIYTVSIVVSNDLIDTIFFEECYPVTYKGVTYSNSTSFEDTVVGATQFGCDSIYRVFVTILENTYSLDLGEDTITCYVNEFVLNATTTGGISYNWQDGSTNPIYTVTQSGEYAVEVMTDICIIFDTINVELAFGPVFNLGEDNIHCEGETIRLNATAPQAISYFWQDGSSAATYNVTEGGLYFVTVKNENCESSDTIDLTFIENPIVTLGPDTLVCVGDTFSLDATSNITTATYQWQDGSTSPTFDVFIDGIYMVTVSNSQCIDKDTIEVRFNDLPEYNLGVDTLLCHDVEWLLAVQDQPEAVTYLWQDNSMGQTFTVTEEGLYFVAVENLCGVTNDTVLVRYGSCNCDFYFPTAFTPNFDGLNDEFGPYVDCDSMQEFSIEIFNRWGESLITMDSPFLTWDASDKDRFPLDTYVWVAQFKWTWRGKEMTATESGAVTIIR